MKRFVVSVLLALITIPAFGSTHKDSFGVSCNELWRAVKDTLRNSGKYGIISIDDKEMTASYNIGGNLTGKRINSAVLNSKDNGVSCELQVQTAFSGLVNDDFADFKKRVNESLAKLRGQPLPVDEGEAPAAPAQASLAIDSTPSGADIEVDGSFVGNTPSTIDVKPGSHQINVKKKGFVTWTRTLTVTGGTIHLNADLDTETPGK
jgi:PEGA domain